MNDKPFLTDWVKVHLYSLNIFFGASDHHNRLSHFEIAQKYCFVFALQAEQLLTLWADLRLFINCFSELANGDVVGQTELDNLSRPFYTNVKTHSKLNSWLTTRRQR